MKIPGPDQFIGKSYQTIKRNIILTLFQSKEEKGGHFLVHFIRLAKP